MHFFFKFLFCLIFIIVIYFQIYLIVLTFQASDKLKPAEEIAKEEKQRLDKLEAERLKRMKGIEDDIVVKHRSADDLDDGYVLCLNIFKMNIKS